MKIQSAADLLVEMQKVARGEIAAPADAALPSAESVTASLARSEAQIAAGQTVPLELPLDRLRSSIARMQDDQ
jgi:hypothetical protein